MIGYLFFILNWFSWFVFGSWMWCWM